MISIENNLENHGYYICGGVKFYSKVQAILHAEKCNLGYDIKFYFNDDIYSAYDWSTEPTKSLEDLYADRARELRNQYDYLVLHFSGGYDSCNVVETFIRNGLEIDELFIRGSIASSERDLTNVSSANNYAEIFFQSIPLAEMIKKDHWPNLKITVLDTIPYTLKTWANNPDWVDNLDLNHFCPSSMYRMDYDELNPEFKRLSESGKKVGHIIGMEKPGIEFVNGEYLIRFMDKITSIHVPRSARLNQMPIYIEPFYWAPTTAPIICKQGHLIKKHIKQNGLDSATVLKMRGNAGREFISSVIYRRTFPILFNQDKAKQEIMEFEWFFFKDQQSAHYQNWRRGMDHLQKTLPARWMHNNRIEDGLLGVFSRGYSLGG
jgi:hypothetical protein